MLVVFLYQDYSPKVGTVPSFGVISTLLPCVVVPDGWFLYTKISTIAPCNTYLKSNFHISIIKKSIVLTSMLFIMKFNLY